MIVWIKKFLNISRNDLILRLYIHKPYAHENLEKFWSNITGVEVTKFRKTIYKPTNLGVKKRPNYKGCLKINIRKSKKFLLMMKMWQNMLVREYLKT